MADQRVGEVEIRVRYAETDRMGRAHHGHYLAWCELGRTALLRERGMPYGELEREGVLLPVTRAEVEYRRGVGFDELVRVETRLARVRSRELTFDYRILGSEDGKPLALARTELVCTDREGRPRRLPAALRAALESLLSPSAWPGGSGGRGVTGFS